MTTTRKKLSLTFHGRVIDHLGIQMYQSPVAAVAELVSNSWDADATEVSISLPKGVGKDAELMIADDGNGMTFEECQNRFLNVGQCRRKNDPEEKTPVKKRPVLGRKGIGKFAGFGIASIIRVETISRETGEKTVFELDIGALRSDEYADSSWKEITVKEYSEPNEKRKQEHGTRVFLKSLTIKRSTSENAFARSMAIRFLLCQQASDFSVLVNDKPLPEDIYSADVEYVFPRDWNSDEIPPSIRFEQDGEWAVEKLTDKREIKWKFVFFKDPIGEEELRGISVFANGKLAQKPFFFNIAGGISGQHALEYLSGQVQANFIDTQPDDIIATERQRINWEHEYVLDLGEWGQNRVKLLSSLWKKKRGEKRRDEVESKISAFATRLAGKTSSDQKTIKQVLTKLGSIETLSDDQFQTLGEAIFQAWEKGRLQDVIDSLATCEDVTADTLLHILVEADVLVALNIAESIRTKLEAIRGLEKMKKERVLENKIRDFIAEKPYLLDPKWDTFKVETSLKYVLDEAAEKAKLVEDGSPADGKRIDLALRSNEHLLVVEFMKPDKKADYDHLSRCRRYVHNIRIKIKSLSALGITRVTGLIVADKLDEAGEVLQEIESLHQLDIWAYSWDALLEQSRARWREYLEIITERAPEDDRLQSLKVHN